MVDMAIYHSPMTLIQVVGFSIAGAGTYQYSLLSKGNQPAISIMKEREEDPRKQSDEESKLLDQESKASFH
jgi:hypothetical protein